MILSKNDQKKIVSIRVAIERKVRGYTTRNIKSTNVNISTYKLSIEKLQVLISSF